MKNGSKLLLSLLIQGAVIGSVVAYQKLKGDKTSDDGFGSDIDELQKKDNQKSEKTEKPESNENVANSVDELLKDVKNFSKTTENLFKQSSTIIEEVLQNFGGERMASSSKNEKAKTEATKPEAPVQAEKQAEPKKPQHQHTKQEKAVNEVPKTVTPSKPVAPSVKTETSPPKNGNNAKTVDQINKELFNQINSYTGGTAKEAPVAKPANPVVPKNKVNLPKPKTIVDGSIPTPKKESLPESSGKKAVVKKTGVKKPVKKTDPTK